MNHGWRIRRLHSGKYFEYLVSMFCSLGHGPAISSFEQNHLPLNVQFGASLDDIADGFIIARGRRFTLAGLFLLPQTHPNMDARSEVFLTHFAARRMFRLHFCHTGIAHGGLPDRGFVLPLHSSREQRGCRRKPERDEVGPACRAGPCPNRSRSASGTYLMRLTLLILLCRLRERQGRFPAGVNRVVDASSVLTYNGIELECGV